MGLSSTGVQLGFRVDGIAYLAARRPTAVGAGQGAGLVRFSRKRVFL